MPKKKMRVLVLSGGPSAEHAISRQSGRMVADALDRRKYVVELAIIDRRRKWHLGGHKGLMTELEALKYCAHRFDVAFLALHGAYGEDGTIQALLESIRLRYTGSPVGPSALAWDKALSNTLMASHGLHIPKWSTVTTLKQIDSWTSWPAFVKPMTNGSSIDVFKINEVRQAKTIVRRLFRRYPRLMVQKYCQGRELTCGVIEDTHGKPQALPITEIQPLRRSFFDYYSKYTAGSTRETTPALLPPSVTRTIHKQSVLAHRMFGCRGLSRSDFILVGSTPWYLETNTIPGLTKISLLPQEAVAAGMTFSQLLDAIIRAAL